MQKSISQCKAPLAQASATVPPKGGLSGEGKGDDCVLSYTAYERVGLQYIDRYNGIYDMMNKEGRAPKDVPYINESAPLQYDAKLSQGERDRAIVSNYDDR
jgi:hypothetical protein